MANSSLFLGIKNMVAAKLGTSDVKLALGTKLLYPLSKPINDAVVTCDSATYNGSNQVAQNIVVTLSGLTLVSGTDYTVTSNTGGTNAGSYSVTVSGAGNYEGSASGTFVINKASGSVTTVPTAKSLTYNGNAQTLVNAGSGTGTMMYKLNSGSWGTSIPSGTNATSYTVYYKASASTNYNESASGSVNVSIAKANITPYVTIANWTYGGTASNPTISGNLGGGTVTYYYKLQSDSSWSQTKPTNAGSYNIRADIAETINTYSGTCSNTFAINKVTPTVVAPTAKSITYNGSEQSLVNAGSTNFGTLKYSLDGISFSTSVPKGINANTYTVYYRVDGNSNVNDVPAQSINAIIEKANGSVTTAPTANSLTYNGNAQTLVNAGSGTGTMMYKLGSGDWGISIPTATNATSYTVYYKASASANYNESASGSVSVTISKVTPTVTAPKACSLTYNGSAQNLVSGGSTNYGSLQYSTTSGGTYSATIPQGTNATSYDVWYKVVGNDNVNSTTPTKVSVTINKADQSAPTATGATTTYNTTATATAGGGGGQGSIEWSNGNTQTSVGSKTTKARWSGNSNYNASPYSNEVTITMNKANISPTVSITNWTYGNTASVPSVTGNLGSGTVTYYYKLSSTSSWSTTKPSNAGSYNIRADIAETTNYNSGTCTNSFTINKANSSLSFTVTNLTVGIGETKTNAVTVNKGDGTITYSSNNTTAVTVNNSGVVTGVGLGNATITANISQTTNYNAASANYTADCGVVVTSKLNVTSTSSPTKIVTITSGFSSIEIDGVKQPSVTTGYTFSTTGEHTVKYYLTSTSIGDSAFYLCTSLTSCTIGNGVTSIGSQCFSNCSSLTSVTIPNSVTSLGESAFIYCRNLTSCTIGNGVTSIGSQCFSNCSSLTSVTIPNSVTSLGTSAFQGCSGLTSCTIGNGVRTIDYAAFAGCSSLTSIVIPNSVTSIGNYAFQSCTSLTSVTIPNSVTSIGNRAFYYCRDLTSIGPTGSGASVEIPNSVTSIGDEVFRDCRGLTSCTIGNSVTNIGENAFRDCRDLTSCTIGNSVTNIGYGAFAYCSGLTSISVNATTPPTLGNDAFYQTNNCLIYVPACSLVSTYKESRGWSSYASRITAPDCPILTAKFNVTSTSNPTRIASAITNFSSIEIDGVKQPSVTTGYTFSTTGEHTVKYYLASTSIDDSVFGNCSSLTSINIPNSIISIGRRAFDYCSGLTSCAIGSGVTSIGNSAFTYCYGLTSINIPNSVTSISDYAFYNCSGLTSCTIGSGVTTIGTGAFRYCSGLTSVVIPNSVTSIGIWAFRDCTGLTSVIIGSGVTSIGSYAFSTCYSLTSITSNATTAPTIDSMAFAYIKRGGTLYVPIGSSGYDVWMRTTSYYLGYYSWTKVEQ